MKKSAFTMLELVFVIVVVGILAAVMIPNMNRNHVEEATLQIAQHIRYAQHLAMNDDVYDDTNVGWRNNFWRITFNTSTTYSIWNGTKSAIDPFSKKNMNNMDLTQDFGVNVTLTGAECTGANGISFDNLGRPYGDVPWPTHDCAITISDGTHTGKLVVRAETGYVEPPVFN